MVAVILPDRNPAAAVPTRSRQSPFLSMASWPFMIVFGTLFCSVIGFISAPGALQFHDSPAIGWAITGASVGFLLSLIACLTSLSDRRIFEANHSLDEQSSTQDQSPTVMELPSNAIAAIMLCIPFAAGIAIWLRQSLSLPSSVVGAVSGATVITTAYLGYFDLRGLLLWTQNREPAEGHPHPMANCLGMLALWVVVYPSHFISRRRLGGKSLVFPAIICTGIFMAPNVMMMFAGPEVPSVDSPEVLALVTQMVSDTQYYKERKAEIGAIAIESPKEVAFNESRKRRVGKATLATNLGEQTIYFTIELRGEGFYVQIFDRRPDE
jgi:hypothetical protein